MIVVFRRVFVCWFEGGCDLKLSKNWNINPQYSPTPESVVTPMKWNDNGPWDVCKMYGQKPLAKTLALWGSEIVTRRAFATPQRFKIKAGEVNTLKNHGYSEVVHKHYTLDFNIFKQFTGKVICDIRLCGLDIYTLYFVSHLSQWSNFFWVFIQYNHHAI